MEINSAIISLDRLKELELAESKVNEPRSKTIIINKGYFGGYFKVQTDDECTEVLANDLRSKAAEIEILEKSISELKDKEDEIDKFNKMSLYELIQWKLSNK